VREQDAWERAKKIAADTLERKDLAPEVGKATHYPLPMCAPIGCANGENVPVGVHTFYAPAGATAPQPPLGRCHRDRGNREKAVSQTETERKPRFQRTPSVVCHPTSVI